MMPDHARLLPMTDTPAVAPLPVLTVEQVADLLQVTPATIRSVINRGDLRAARVGRQHRITREALDAYLEAQR